MTDPTHTKIGGPDAPYRKEQKAKSVPLKSIRQIAVQIAREADGQIYSRVVDKADRNPWNGEPQEIVIDRKNRVIDARVIKVRAEMLAKMLGVPFEEDLRWPCVANKKMPCRCPKCIEEGRA